VTGDDIGTGVPGFTTSFYWGSSCSNVCSIVFVLHLCLWCFYFESGSCLYPNIPSELEFSISIIRYDISVNYLQRIPILPA